MINLKNKIMLYPDDELENQRKEPSMGQANAYRVDDDNEEDDESLERSYTDKNEVKPVTEGQPMGGQNFGDKNVTESGDDKNNPSQNAGYRNEYFRRTEPSEEHTESNNFKPGEDQTYNEGPTDSDG
jgi:hypothetical protein